MKQAFIIMQIGNPDLDVICRDAIVPALKSCGLEPKRVDKHNVGGLLKSEIVGFIESSDIIIADLTNERPNCYLEVGYAMGRDKFLNLILTAREDHNQDSPKHKRGGPKIHFDLIGYDILFWNPDDPIGFKEELEKRVKRRLKTLLSDVASPVSLSPWDEKWISTHQEAAMAGLKKSGKSGFMEIRMTIPDSKLSIPQTELLRVAEQAQIHTFGWPLGVVLSREEYRPRPTRDGIVAEVSTKDEKNYDYWTIRRDGTFYLLKSLFEDISSPSPKRIFFNTRIVRITEALLYAKQLYSGFNVPPDSRVLVRIRHGGLKGRILGAAGGGRELNHERKSQEDEICTEIETSIEKIGSDIVSLVDELTQPLFVVFDFFKVNFRVLKDIVNNYLAGKTT